MENLVEVIFKATIKLPVTEELEQGDIEQAVQNEVGHTGAVVITAHLLDG